MMLVVLGFLGALTGVSSDFPYQIVKKYDDNGLLQRTVVLPKLEDPEDYVLVSHSSSFAVNTTQSPPTVRRIRKRRRKKKPNKTVEKTPLDSPKDSKFLNLFTIVRFPNDDCPNGGTCYHQYECDNRGGTASGTCAKGFGVCCMVETKCGGSGDMDKRLFRGGDSEVCSLTIEKKGCARQIRLDFIDFQLDGPTDGNCFSERLLITGQNKNSPVPVLCGALTGQHMYIDVDESNGPVAVSVLSEQKKDFRIKVSQLCDNDRLLAPKHCLQYYTEMSGAVQSFNYVLPPAESSYINNLNYAICIRKGTGMCSIRYSNEENGSEMPFEINNIDPEGSMTVPPGEAGAEVFNCPDDFITVRSVRLCGQKVNDATLEPDFTRNAPIIDTSSGPFMVSVVTDSAVSGRGFKLYYKQTPCYS